jgi:VCBS repeat-containing protein
VNDAPAATADTATVAQDSDTGVVIDVLNNDEDVDGDPLTITAVGKAANGIVAISSDKKTVTYTPDEGFNGTDGFTYTVSDGNGGTATAEVTVTVVPKPVNNPPVADNKNVETKVNTPISDKITASDPDKNPLSYSKNTDPEHGNVTVETDGSWTYTPNKDYTGKDSFIVIVDDGNGGKTESTVTITVNPKQQPTSSSPSPAPVSSNHNPVVPDYTSFTEVNKPVGGRVIATDSDKDTLLYSLLTVPRKGQVSVKSNGEWTYTPDTGYIGEDLFQVTVSDGKGGTAVSKISIEVEAIPLGSSKDVAVVIRVDKIMIEEYGEGKFTIAYYNKLESTVSNTVVSVLLPEGTIANNYGNGVLNENEIQWNIGNLQPRAKGQLSFNLSFGKIDTPQEIVDIEAAITSTDKLITPEDDKSLISVLIYSQEQGTKHQRYMQGYPDGLFGPDKPITREEIAAILARILELEAEGQEEQIYGDVSLDRWSAEYIDAVTDAKLFIGSSDGNFYPEASITRAELASVIARYLKVEMAKGVVPQEYHYNDIEGHWAASSIEEILRFGVLLGNDDGKFDPDKTMTRKEAVIMMNRMFFRGPLTGTKTIWEDVPEDMPGWEDILEATISHESTYTKDQSELFMKKTADPAWQK